MNVLISLPVVLVLMMLQTTIARQVTLLSGSVDLLLVWIAAWALLSKDNSAWLWAVVAGLVFGFVSAVPWYTSIIAYLAVVAMAKFIRGKLWQSPLLSMFVITIFGSIVLYTLTFVGLRLQGTDYPWQDTLVRIIIPSIFLNLFIAIPIHALARDSVRWIIGTEVE
jgi:cell shape-determining protein MreD